MKIKFHKGATEFIPEWNGNKALPVSEQVKVILNPIQMGDLLDIVDAISQQNAGTTNLRPIMTVAQSVLPKYAQIVNLEDDDGPVDIEKVLTFPAFLTLVPEIVNQMANMASVSGDEEKNLNTPPA